MHGMIMEFIRSLSLSPQSLELARNNTNDNTPSPRIHLIMYTIRDYTDFHKEPPRFVAHARIAQSKCEIQNVRIPMKKMFTLDFIRFIREKMILIGMEYFHTANRLNVRACYCCFCWCYRSFYHPIRFSLILMCQLAHFDFHSGFMASRL